MCPSYGICPSGSVNHRPSKTRPPTRHCLKVPPQYLSCTVIKPRSLSVLPAGCHGEKLSVDGSRQGEEWMLVSSILIIHYVLGRGGGVCWLLCFSHISLFTCHKIYMSLTHKYRRQRHFSLTHREADINFAKFTKTHRIEIAHHKEYDSLRERTLKSGGQFSILFHQELNCFQVWEWKGF